MASLARLSLRWRVTLVALCVEAIILAAFGAFISLRLSHDVTAGIDASLSARATQLVSAVGDGAGSQGNFSDSGDVKVPGLPARESLAQVLALNGVVLQSAGSPDADRGLLTSAELARARKGAVRVTRTLPALGSARLLAVPAGSQQVVVVGSALATVDRAGSQLLVLLVAGGLVALAVGGFASWWLAGRALRPIDRLSIVAASIEGDDLDRRVPVPPGAAEAARLARTLNGLLERVSRAVEKERAFLADASHELRTPVAVLQAELEVALLSPSTPEAAREVLESLTDETGRLSRLTDDLLVLARADAGRLDLVRHETDLADPAARVSERLRPLAERHGVRVLTRLDPAPVRADNDRISQVALNLIDNAIRHTRPGGSIRVETGQSADEAYLLVADEGPGVPDELAPRIFERFSRGDASRGREGGETGLGLAIALAIARAHGGLLRLEETGPQGSRFVLRLPSAT